MLSPDQLESAGDLVAAVYTEIEAQMLDHLVDALINGERLTERTVTELALLSQTHDAALRKIVEDNRAMIEDAVLETAERFLRESDTDDVERVGGDAKYPQQISATIAGMSTVLARDNLDMVDGAKRAFLTATTEAVTKTNSGLFTSEQAIHGAVRKLEREGIPIITYRNTKTGVQTVQNKVDVAVRRHVRTQISQDANRMTEERIRELDIDLVEVSSHPDARPSHAEWQGKCYSLKGEVVIDGTKYPDFWTSCMSGTLGDILGGVNCRHSYGPYRHGAPRAYSPNPQHPSGMPGPEIYEMEQHQRYLERLIRADKRELRGTQKLYENDPKSLTAKTNLLKAQKQLRDRQAAMRKFINESNAKSNNPNVRILTRNPRREWAGDMPKGVKVSASHRKLDAFLDSRAKQLKTAGISRARMKGAISGEMAKRGGTAKDFASLSASEQKAIFQVALTRSKPTSTEVRRANIKPVNEQLYASQKNYVERHGGTVIRGGKEVEEHLDSLRVDGAQIGDAILLRGTPTTSEVLEEVYHFKQEQRGDYAECNVDEMFLRREIDAQNWLLSVTKRYNIPEAEVEITRANLRDYEDKLSQLERGRS